jgi:hypothetical protein
VKSTTQLDIVGFSIDRETHFQCFGGEPFYPTDPTRSLHRITIETIAVVLSRICRFQGRTKRFYSVAEHSLNVSGRLPKSFQLAGLLHDAHEAYSGFGDVCGTIKPAFLEDIEGEIDVAIAAKFRFDVESLWLPQVKEADAFMLAQERHWLLEESEPSVDWGEIANIAADPEYSHLAIPTSADEIRESFETKLRALLVRK